MNPDDTTPNESPLNAIHDIVDLDIVDHVVAYPAGYAESENALTTALIDDLENYRIANSKKWFNGNRQAITKVAPILDRVGIDSLEGLRDVEALGDLRRAVTRADAEGELGAPTTAGKYLSDFAKCCAAFGLNEHDSKRLRGVFKQARKDSARPLVKAPPITKEMLASMVAEMDVWLRAPAIPWEGCPEGVLTIDGDVVRCPTRGWRLTPLRRDRVLAFIALQVCGAMRSGDTLDLRVGDIRGRRIQARKHKNRTNPTRFSFTLFEPYARFAIPLMDRHADDPEEKRLFDSNVTNGVRMLLLAAGWPEHYGCVGLHGVRKTAMQANYEAGVPASEASAMLGNTPAVAEAVYAVNTKDVRDGVARGHWADWNAAGVEEIPDWKYGTDPPVPFELLSGGHPWTQIANPWDGERPRDDPQGDAIPIAEGQGAPFNGLWRFRRVVIKMPWGEWRDDVAYESNQRDLVVRHFPVLREDGTWVPDENGNPANRTLWLERGGLAQAAEPFWARADLSEVVGLPGFEPESNAPMWLPIEVIIGRYAALVEAALDAGRTDEARRLLMLLKSLGGEVP